MSPGVLKKLASYREMGFQDPLGSFLAITRNGRKAWDRINSDPELRAYWDAIHAHAARTSVLITEGGMLMSVSVEPHRPQWQRTLRRWWLNLRWHRSLR